MQTCEEGGPLQKAKSRMGRERALPAAAWRGQHAGRDGRAAAPCCPATPPCSHAGAAASARAAAHSRSARASGAHAHAPGRGGITTPMMRCLDPWVVAAGGCPPARAYSQAHASPPRPVSAGYVAGGAQQLPADAQPPRACPRPPARPRSKLYGPPLLTGAQVLLASSSERVGEDRVWVTQAVLQRAPGPYTLQVQAVQGLSVELRLTVRARGTRAARPGGACLPPAPRTRQAPQAH